jgi:hypothetical protein
VDRLARRPRSLPAAVVGSEVPGDPPRGPAVGELRGHDATQVGIERQETRLRPPGSFPSRLFSGGGPTGLAPAIAIGLPADGRGPSTRFSGDGAQRPAHRQTGGDRLSFTHRRRPHPASRYKTSAEALAEHDIRAVRGQPSWDSCPASSSPLKGAVPIVVLAQKAAATRPLARVRHRRLGATDRPRARRTPVGGFLSRERRVSRPHDGGRRCSGLDLEHYSRPQLPLPDTG